MTKKHIKFFLKNNRFVHKLVVYIIFLYLKIVYMTNKWVFILPKNLTQEEINAKNGVLFAIWHNRLAFAMYICKNYDGVYGLASPHSDGQLITDILKKMNYKIIEGSTNRNPMQAIKSIIKQITSGNKVVITPDGPRGPVYQINSNITQLGKKYNKDVIPISCMPTKYFQLKSWDNMIIPKFFGKVVVTIGAPLELYGDAIKDNALLKNRLMELSDKAKLMLNSKKDELK